MNSQIVSRGQEFHTKGLPSDSASVEFLVHRISRFLYMPGDSLSHSPDNSTRESQVSRGTSKGEKKNSLILFIEVKFTKFL